MCDCIKSTNEYLAQHNTKITIPWLGTQRPFVQTEKIDGKKRNKPMMLFASYCPFCGEKYEESKPLFSVKEEVKHD
jgi:hypothetical protein